MTKLLTNFSCVHIIYSVSKQAITLFKCHVLQFFTLINYWTHQAKIFNDDISGKKKNKRQKTPKLNIID